ncbi:hypothetical protein Bca52824_094341 [Brassica carinata]|uniref:Uncharacterized protein n=1 Tax=Brassica carinata TaxID=52824 RepID=A0A8X7TJX1_BRACI|nr:hypothetical protein Bca52824_094341 [Brassica carinata]
MASSKVSCMLVSLLLLVLVLSDMDKALGRPIQLGNLIKPKPSFPFPSSMSAEKLKKSIEMARIPQELVGVCVNDEKCKSTMKNAYEYMLKAKSHPSDICENDKKCKSTMKNAYEYMLKAKSHPSP